jgi:hypothetical protein
MKSILFFFLFLVSHIFAVKVAAGQLIYINVIDEVVYFSTDEAKTSTPSCVIAASAEQWTVSLNNKTGRALYALLVTAMSAKQDVSIESAGDCNDAPGVERAEGVSAVAAKENEAINTESRNVSFMGYTNNVSGKFARTAYKHPVLAASELCQAKYPGARVMLWDDYVSIIAEYPNSEDIWFLDIVNREKDGLVVLKSGDEFTGNSSSSPRNFTCSSWTTEDRYGYTGFILQRSGRFHKRACHYVSALACVK